MRAKAKGTSGGLTGIRKLILFHGDPILPCTPAEDFSNDAEAKVTWDQHRDDLLSEYITMEPGKRPWAWWRFDALEACPGDGWFSQYDRLEALGQITPDEALRFERRHFPAHNIPDADECARSVVDCTRRDRYSPGTLRGMIAERQFRARWYGARGEETPAKFHELVAQGLQTILEERGIL